MAKADNSVSRTALTHARLRELLRYEPDTGNLIWRVRRSKGGSGAQVGDTAGYTAEDGYVRVSVDNRRYLAHRLAWFWMIGAWPVGTIDHRNRKKADNRWDNLREATYSQNGVNRHRTRKHHLPRGVYPADGTGRFNAKIGIRGKVLCLGSFDTPEQAHAAYLTAATSKYGAFLPDEVSKIRPK
ncbi:HNH endonuclease signature motif containing protein [Methylobacterium symbioticum]|uniref:HNH nuclease domain-containing protein n=1 Tax=Methylobacterium symbioticum TaxID=2584084 RepID=A0A509EC60_9HYPH|nr:HNH endonuclease signature motif containing protein [Methylobacterium symbioticum]VUD71847.1 hypothetical protein MET9862_02436 [Methylobacterium symbioticum]